MDRVLLDTDVLMDFFFDREPFAKYATNVLNQCESGKLGGYTTPVIICNVYYLLRKTAGHEIIVERIKQLLTIIDVLEQNRDVVIDSLNSEFRDFEDALQHFSAVRSGNINLILTRNSKDFRKSDLPVLTPESYIKGKFGSG